MKIQHFAKIIGFSALVIAFSAQAHNPDEHMKDAEQPDCTAMKTMDHSKMDMDDPVQQAMLKQCMKDMHNNESEMHEVHTGPQDKDDSVDEQHSEHKH